MQITAQIGNRTVTRDQVLAWEDRRARHVLKRLHLPFVEDRLARRRLLVERKLELGHDGIRAMLAKDLQWSERVARLVCAVSGAKRRFSVCELAVSAGSAEQFAHWFEERSRLGDERPMIDACPDHYIIALDAQGRQVVLETTGGSPFASEFTVDYGDLSSLQTTPDAAFPHQVAGVARLDGLAIGGVRHQFRQDGAGFRARLTVEFPAAMAGFMVSAHQWHLAAEFSNWIEAANA